MSFKQYRFLDLFIFLGIYALCEFLVIKAATEWFNEPYSVSIMLSVLLIVMMRWDKFAVLPAVLCAVLFVAYQGGTMQQFGIYLIGNLGFMANLLVVKAFGKEKIRTSPFNTMVYVVTGFLFMAVFRGIGAVIIDGSDIRMILQFILTDALNLVFSLVVVLIARTIDGLFIDQKKYLLDLNREKEAAKDDFGV